MRLALRESVVYPYLANVRSSVYVKHGSLRQ